MPDRKLTEAQARALKVIAEGRVLWERWAGGCRYRVTGPGPVPRADVLDRVLYRGLAFRFGVRKRNNGLLGVNPAGREALREWEDAHA